MSVVIDSLSKLDLDRFNSCVACSGGLDSTVLLEAIIQLGFKPKVLHINYQLRGEDSEKDEKLVHDLADKYHLELEVVRCPKEVTQGKGINLQEAARNFRHELFLQFIQKNPANRVFLGHHQGDQTETFFLQLLRGAGIFGLGGMHLERNGIIRPFLNVSKEDLRRFANENQLVWREDLSNQENKYKRNQFRNEIIPSLLEEIPSLIDSIQIIQQVFRDEQQAICERLTERLIKWESQFGMDYSDWDALTIEERIVVCNHFNWPFWMLERIQEFKDSKLSSKMDESPIFRTKRGISWNKNFQEINCWEFKSEEVEFLPTTFDAWEVYLDGRIGIDSIVRGFANKSDTIERIGVKGRTNVYKMLKDHGIPEQWRSSYPIFRINEEVSWIPGIAVSKKYLATPFSSLIIKLSKDLINH
jgi:tRNA(Ile)-lysidine synthase